MPLEQLVLVFPYADEAAIVIKQLFYSLEAPEMDKSWHPTPPMCEEPTNINPFEGLGFDEVIKVSEIKKIERTVDYDHRKAFLGQFSTKKAQLTPGEQAKADQSLIKYRRLLP